MEVKLFGKSLFSIHKDGGGLHVLSAEEALKKSEYLPDFHTNTHNSIQFNDAILVDNWNGTVVASGGTSVNAAVTKKEPPKTTKSPVTPKRLYQLKALNDDGFALKTDAKYVSEQVQSFKTKLSMYKNKETDYRGSNEIQSILIRLENRKKYPKFREFYEEFPYTTTERINSVIKKNSHLKMAGVSQFLADMPNEAVCVMKNYTDKTRELCDKKPVFYIIANKKDFEKTDKRRDPILLAQSPFAHVWQILGAWDEEMLLLEDL